MTSMHKRVKFACYSSNISMSVVGNLPPVLFLTFRELYGISFSLLGALVLVNFVTQLIVDLIFSFFSHKFNIPATVKAMPYLTFIGFVLYALAPVMFPGSIYVGLVLGTVVFSASSGLGEVLISPVIAALPSDDPDREMSALHSIYAWGTVFVIIISTLFILFIGKENWQYLVLLFTAIPVLCTILFARAKLPEMETPEKVSDIGRFAKNKWLYLCVLAIFLGGSAEVTMAQWSSGYLEEALGIPKVWGDIFGVALFAVMLGIGRTLYAKIGRNIGKVITLGAVGATVCYLVAAITDIPLIGLIACAFTGFCTSMLWPGNLVIASDKFKEGGVFIFAMMAAGGDLGASIGPQLVGVITDAALSNPQTLALAEKLAIAPESLSLKLGLFTGMLFPLAAIPLYNYMRKNKDK